MANTLKSKSTPKVNSPILNPDKEADVLVSEVVKDERTMKILGAVSLLVSLFLFVAFTSYLFTWQEDQDMVQLWRTQLFSLQDVKANNLLGYIGAFVAYQMMFNGFGIAAYLFCTFFFVLGVNLFFTKPIFSLWRNVRYVLLGLLVLSTCFAYLTPNTTFSWGGALGEYSSGWLTKWVGTFGTGAILFIAGFSYIIWRFNPSFNVPNFDFLIPKKKAPEFVSEDREEAVKQEWDLNNPAPEEATIPTGNSLKENTSGVSVIMPEMDETDEALGELGPKLFIDELSLNEEPGEEKKTPLEADDIDVDEEADSDDEDLDIDDELLEDLDLEINEVPKEKIVAAVGSLTTKYDATLDLKNYKYPHINLLETHGSEKIVQDPEELETYKNQIIATLKNYDIAIQRISATVGPTVTLYEIVPAPGVRISRIKNLEDDIALSLAALGIRIIAPIPGKGTIGIEVPNIRKSIVSMKTLLASEKFVNSQHSLPIAIGKKIDNENFIVDLASMPHLLMAGATGQGKSVGLNAILVSLLYKKHPSQLKFVLVDPKKVELSLYRVIEKHFLAKLPGEEDAIITDTKKVINTLNALCIEMDNRYDLLKEAGCRNIKEYNEKFTSRKLNPEKGHQYLPFIVLVVDEFADLIMTAGKEVEMPIARLAQLARAVGIHLIIATQRPSVNIITGTIKANFPARIAFKVSSKIDSRTILDAGGAEQLIGKGDMLVSYNGEITRLQCAFVDTPEVDRVCNFIAEQKGYPEAFILPEYIDEKDLEASGFDAGERDSLFEDAAKLIVSAQVGSTSFIQRRMKLGYNRAGRLMDQLESAGIVGPSQGSKPREVLYKSDAELYDFLQNLS
ncbi:MAG: DNA translocase FtsK 4TM domain-containing protein [Sediminibacterium sp.]|jgi:S-DNA-T family DNA segregation ATPase FtsK/SpoIIIE